MSKKKRSKAHLPPSVQARVQRRQAAATRATNTRWWVMAAVAIVVVGIALWFTVGPGKPAEPVEPDVSDRNGMYSGPPEMQIDAENLYIATIATAKGDIVVQLDAAAAPQTVSNFVFLARDGFYDGLTFHRVEQGLIQGGDPLAEGTGGPGYTVPAEIGLPHIEGAIAMARQGDAVNPERESSGSQFYICLQALPTLDGAYTVFGQVIAGLDVARQIEEQDVIETITIEEAAG